MAFRQASGAPRGKEVNHQHRHQLLSLSAMLVQVVAIIVINDTTNPGLHIYSGSNTTYNLQAFKL